MVRRLHRFALLALVLAVGCVDENPSLIVTGVIFPDREEGCLWTCNGSNNDVLQPSGIYDPVVDNGSGYFAGACLANFRVNNGSSFRADTGRILVRRANIEITGVNGESLVGAGIAPFSVPLTSSIPSAADTSGPATQALVINLIPSSVGEVLAANITGLAAQTGSDSVLVTFTVEGETSGGIDVESSPSTFPVRIVRGDLACVTPLIDTEITGPCASGVDTTEQVLANSARQMELDAALTGAGAPPLASCF